MLGFFFYRFLLIKGEFIYAGYVIDCELVFDPYIPCIVIAFKGD